MKAWARHQTSKRDTGNHTEHAKQKEVGNLKKRPREPSTKDEGTSSKKPMKERSSLDSAVLQANKMKAIYIQTTADFSMIMQMIQKDPCWVWAANCQQVLKESEELLQARMTTFARKYMTHDIKHLKKTFTAPMLEADAVKMCDSLREPLDALSKEVRMIKNMHSSRSKS